ncbi:4Fe-4S binding protein [Thalassococcus sp. S3]|uniref:4Fe-4S binding protein n=1 Tax=Thalassococcus sp. S3 TaxID=2017482 RepID=UPI0010246D65|nr:4Fe-4S binding protein [Thalassococcus sp. S3]QBF33975.1 hypothetical protein CFI11_22605 [Thalassococcus sp. S3]
MFARTSERSMFTLRSALLLAWLGLIASLFWDPVTAELTRPENLSSPFRIDKPVAEMQGQTYDVPPYEMGARIFWTMAVPLVPLFLMVFGHEAWRRICPLSMASQIPRYLGLRRWKTKVQRRTGKLDRVLALIDQDSWLARNVWYFQFWLLFLGINARLLFINSDRTALAIALLSIIVAAIVVGILWGGKTWCNYFCPVNVVQKIYTEPRGLLESAPHLLRPRLPQSICRSSGPNGDQTACVACTASCGDIDLERSYWDGISNPQRRKVYYMFLGLIVGFYGYYYLYSGNWDYYFSGFWTHEADTLGKLLDPGFFLMGREVPIPKLAAVPITMSLSCLTSLIIGMLAERLYRYIRRNDTITEADIINQCLSVSAWLSINTFYFFGGRPNLLLLPSLAMHVVDLVIVALSTMWLWQALQCSPLKYQRESMASSLLGQLKKLKVDVSRYLGGRPLDDLKPDEIYVLTKVLPAFSHEQKLMAYRNILDEAITLGTTASPSSLRLLHDFRTQMDISDAEHLRLLEELGVPDTSTADIVQLSDAEKQACLANYREIVGSSVAERISTGLSLDAILNDRTFQSTIEIMQASLQITGAEHQRVIAELCGPGGRLSQAMLETNESLAEKLAVRLAIEATDTGDPLTASLVELTLRVLDTQIAALLSHGLSILRVLQDAPPARWHAADMAALAGDLLDRMMQGDVAPDQSMTWKTTLAPEIVQILQGHDPQDIFPEPMDRPDDIPPRNLRDVVSASFDRKASFEVLLSDDDHFLLALGLTLYTYEDLECARSAAARLMQEVPDGHWLLQDVFDRLTDPDAVRQQDQNPDLAIRAELTLPGQPVQVMTFRDGQLSVGRALSNDIVIAHPSVWAYHGALRFSHGDLRLVRVGSAELAVNSKAVLDESTILPADATVRFGPPGDNAPSLKLHWEEDAANGRILPLEPVMRMAMLGQNRQLRNLPIRTLSEIAATARIRRQVLGDKILPKDADIYSYLVSFGSVRAFDPGDFETATTQIFEAGDLIEPSLTQTGSPIVLEVASDFALTIQLEDHPELAVARQKAGASVRRQPTPAMDATIFDVTPAHSD